MVLTSTHARQAASAVLDVSFPQMQVLKSHLTAPGQLRLDPAHDLTRVAVEPWTAGDDEKGFHAMPNG
jgi:hypothetical protein